MRSRKGISGLVLVLTLSLAGAARADLTVNGTIEWLDGQQPGSPAIDDTTTTVDHILFTVNTADLITIDVLSWEYDFSTQMPVDVNNDGEIAFIDSFIYLFHDDGNLGTDDLVAWNDNGLLGADGSISGLDSFLELNLAAGNYLLAIGDSDLSAANAVAGLNPGSSGPYTAYPFSEQFLISDHGDYRVEIGGDVSIVPIPGSVALAGIGLLLVGRRRPA